MENIENHKSKKYEYLSSNYDTIYNKGSKENELLNKNCDSTVVYNYDHTLLSESNSNTRINSYSNNMKDYSNEDNYHYGKNNSKYSKSMEKVKLINSNKSLHQVNNNRYNNINYDSNEEDCSETHYHFENKYNHEKDLESICLFVYIGVLLQDISNISELEHHWSNLIILFVGFILGVVAIAYISVVTKRRLNNLNIMNTSLSTTNIDIE
ncbi:hypothetical protein POVWA2_033920 [Plasmodium ovale wallikeri]|uniref:Uncharacterized protein n=1 Tax=Plasmodium ovale wallikeri TaxID=864142 RepID=A0A1A8Z0P1_PLAOA|nr:hypothetical protein POVWA1_034760 [Plasmodium ovale wallikeri]SBT37505.1 hypothetical protein POVWA2_033920 [Plasmodium ovale wallikeri]